MHSLEAPPTTRMARFADWLGVHAPGIHRVVRPPWRALKRKLGRPGYWQSRLNYAYYAEAIRSARERVPGGGSVLDVGSHETELLQRLDWFQRRVALDRRYVPPQPGIEMVRADFMGWDPEGSFDLVLCLQVLEHVADPSAFARKLLSCGRTVIVSVPYRWPVDRSPGHLNDPVDELKLRAWAGRDPLESKVVANGGERLLAVYAGDA